MINFHLENGSFNLIYLTNFFSKLFNTNVTVALLLLLFSVSFYDIKKNSEQALTILQPFMWLRWWWLLFMLLGCIIADQVLRSYSCLFIYLLYKFLLGNLPQHSWGKALMILMNCYRISRF